MNKSKTAKPEMNPLDYGKSFVIGKKPANEVRFWVESRTRIIDENTGKYEEYIVASSCKSEDVNTKRNLFLNDNYDFLPIFGPKHGIIFRRNAWLNSGYKRRYKTKDMWGGQKYHLEKAKFFKRLTTNKSVIRAAHKFQPIVAQTEIYNSETKLRAIIGCPVKTLNTNQQKNAFQVDTGVIAFPDLTKKYMHNAERFSPAFMAFNTMNYTEFIIEAPTPIHKKGIMGRKGEEICKVYHYSQILGMNTKNMLYAIKSK